MVFCTWGEPGRAVMVKVNAPRAMEPGISLLGMSAALKREMAMGKNHEGYHKEGNASVCKDCAAQDNCQYSSFLAKPAGDKMGDGIRIPAYLH